ncbi:hypothetical protein F7725_009128 [Dissostichus mawsoni]|uniref:Uncharacterized protein n=1 Tax=Dissostichus mawsoni TaxID=36200 RepID=A0A7J5Z845_DISMA|nr:hypothetical protein F7725_009128 [Dissostichus mawsoni]
MAGTSAQSGDRNSSVAAAAHTLITALTQHLSQGQPEGRKEDQTLPGPSVEQEMARSFPGFFVKKNRNCLGKRKLPALKTFATQAKKNWRPFTFYVYLLNLNADSTPTASEEFALAQAGLGKRHISMPLDMSHEESPEKGISKVAGAGWRMAPLQINRCKTCVK